jgi:hypothetical protein
MDLLAHALWAGVAAETLRRRRGLHARPALALVGLATLPDLMQGLPVAAWALGSAGSPALLWDFATASPGTEPVLPEAVHLVAHHLHCIGHSAVIAAGVTAAALALRWRQTVVLAGWWLHIVIDVFTHSADFYPVPVLYPFTQRGFDGLAWNTPWFQSLNYAALAAAALWLWRARRR